MRLFLNSRITTIIQSFTIFLMILIWCISPYVNIQSESLDYNISSEYWTDGDDEDDDDEDDDDEDDDDEDDDGNVDSDNQSRIKSNNPMIKFLLYFAIFLIAIGSQSPLASNYSESEEE